MSPDPSSRPAPPFVPRSGRDRQRLADLRQAWGQPVARERPTDLIALFHRHAASLAKPSVIDDSTWSDLGLDEVFATIDRTTGMPGRQVLYHRLRTYETDPAVLAERARQHGIFRRDATARERIQLLMTRLDGAGAAYLVPLLVRELPPAPPAAWLFLLLSALTPACLVGMFFLHALFLPALLLVCINVVIYATYGQKILPHFTGFSQVVALLATAKELGQLPDSHALPPLAKLRGSSALITTVQKQLGWLAMDRTSLPELIQALFGYLNMLCLLDTVVFLHAIRSLRTHRQTLVEVFEAVGALDASIAVASYLESVPGACVPNLVASRHLDVTGLYHPLIPAAVANDLALTDRSALVAGPNMAGKTAFVRTLALNLVFAQTLHFCLAQRAILPRAIVRSAIRREDALVEGSSYFFTEIKQVLGFTQAPADGPLHVFLIDEIFRGTNTVERIAASAAVLRHLAQHHIVFATTHDFELQDLLADTYALYHFSDQVVDGRYGFDYRIRPGPVRSRNAIKLLELSGYPPSIVAEATQLASHLETSPRRAPTAA
ncbi:MAG: hypothetical protein NTV51_20415 [Verrucomicrobia bacterium]|nr:hypothetical protein [Verrucomicrobiota bacterium]